MADFVYYNNNPRGMTVNDCVTRAISLGSGLPYEEVAEKLWLTADLYNCDRLCKFCYSKFIEDVLGFPQVYCDNMDVGEFADRHPYGKYLVRISGHLTALVDGKVFDVWDCRDELCDLAWQCI